MPAGGDKDDYYRTLFEISPASIILEDEGGLILDVNPAFTSILGYDRSEVVGRHVSMFSSSDSRKDIDDHIRKILRGKTFRHMVKNRRKNGEECFLDLNETALLLRGGRREILCVATDITESVRSTQALRDSESRLGGILSSMIDMVFAFDRDQRFVFYHLPEGVKLYRDPTVFMGKTHGEVMPPETDLLFQSAFAATRRGESVTYEYSLGNPQAPEWYSCKLSPLLLDGAFQGAVGVVANITDRRRAEEALRRHSLVYRSVDEAVLVFDRDGCFIDVNPAAERITGWSRSELLGRPAAMINPKNRARRIREEIMDGLDRNGVWSGEIPLVTKEGRRRTLSAVISCLRDTDGKRIGTIGINRDVTDQKRIEEELARTQKLESLGVFAGGIAHDFNNLLMRIMANASLAAGAEKEEAAGLLREIEDACREATGLTRRLLTFSRGGAPAKIPLAVGDMLRECVDFALRGSRTDCAFAIPEDLWPIEADPGQIAQVIGHLTANALQAMPEGGELLVGAENVFLSENGPALLLPGKYVKITVRDSGTGISEETRSRIFDPFFSTRDGGTGLGLTICHSIVKNHGGSIAVDSETGRGATFTVHLPAVEYPGDPGEDSEPGGERGRGRILVMDDDPAVLKITRRMLERLGYGVETACAGEEAVDAYLRGLSADQPFTAAIVDLTVPGGMGGKEAARLIARHDPAARIVVASGYSDDPILADFRSYGFAGMIVKPYTIAALGRELARVLASR